MLLVIDVGNTETALGLHDGDDWAGRWRMSTSSHRTADELSVSVSAMVGPALAGGSLRAAVVGSVVPQVTPLLVDALDSAFGVRTTVIDSSTPLPIRLDVDEPRTVGADRVVNTLAAFRLFKRDTIVVDLGTATTFDCITADGAFIGGVITPGVLTSAERLISRTAMLPQVGLVPPERVIGRRTEACLHSGIFYGAVDQIEGMVKRIRTEWGTNPLVVATGGLASVIAVHAPSVERIEPTLTLDGLRFAWEHVSGIDS